MKMTFAYYFITVFLLLNTPIFSYSQDSIPIDSAWNARFHDSERHVPIQPDSFWFEVLPSSPAYMFSDSGFSLPPIYFLDRDAIMPLHHSGSFTRQTFSFFNNPAGDLFLWVNGNELDTAQFANYPNRQWSQEDLHIKKSKIRWTDNSLEVFYSAPSQDSSSTFNLYHRIWIEKSSFFHQIRYHYSKLPQITKRRFKKDDCVTLEFRRLEYPITLVRTEFRDKMQWMIYKE